MYSQAPPPPLSTWASTLLKWISFILLTIFNNPPQMIFQTKQKPNQSSALYLFLSVVSFEVVFAMVFLIYKCYLMLYMLDLTMVFASKRSIGIGQKPYNLNTDYCIPLFHQISIEIHFKSREKVC